MAVYGDDEHRCPTCAWAELTFGPDGVTRICRLGPPQAVLQMSTGQILTTALPVADDDWCSYWTEPGE